jgi:hypothetical protein
MSHRLADVAVGALVVAALAACGGSVGYGKAADATRASRTIDVRILPWQTSTTPWASPWAAARR